MKTKYDVFASSGQLGFSTDCVSSKPSDYSEVRLDNIIFGNDVSGAGLVFVITFNAARPHELTMEG